MLMKEAQELRDTKDDDADVAKLARALESEKLGASRAVSQNQQLKEQLTEMENAFVTLVSDIILHNIYDLMLYVDLKKRFYFLILFSTFICYKILSHFKQFIIIIFSF